MTSLLTILLVLLLIFMVCMAIRDGRPFFSDFLKVSALVISFLIAILTWFPLIKR